MTPSPYVTEKEVDEKIANLKGWFAELVKGLRESMNNLDDAIRGREGLNQLFARVEHEREERTNMRAEMDRMQEMISQLRERWWKVAGICLGFGVVGGFVAEKLFGK